MDIIKLYKSKSFIPVLCAVFCLVTLSLSLAVIGFASNNDTEAYYFDSNASANGSGTEASPFNSLDAIEGLELQPGDGIFLKKGSNFEGSLKLIGINGNEQNTITISSYGEGAKPRINGCDTHDVIYIENCSYITISDIDVCDTATYEAERRGVYIYGSCGESLSGITIDGVYVHHIRGIDNRENSGAIIAECDDKTNFEALTIKNCYITDIDGVGISVVGGSYSHHINTCITSNRISEVKGSGVYMSNLLGGECRNNVVFDIFGEGGFVTESLSNTLIERNEAYKAAGTAFLALENSFDVIWQYNYSHDNEGGFFYSESGNSATIRYNLSLGDKSAIISGVNAGLSVYNNTFVSLEGTEPKILDMNGGSIYYASNVIYNASMNAAISLDSCPVKQISHNLVYNTGLGYVFALDAFKQLNSNGVYSDPEFAEEFGNSVSARCGIETAVYFCLKSGSEALTSGIVTDSSSKDFFDNSSASAIGFYCGSGEDKVSVDYELKAENFSEYRYSDIEIVKDILYGTATSYKGNIKELKLDLYFANDCEDQNRPLLVMIHGGGLRSDSTKEQSYAVKISKLMASKGYVVASINYRTREGSDMPDKPSAAPALMDAAEDTNTAIEWLRLHSSEYGFNPDYIFVAGGSAGGATAMTYAFAEDSRGFNKDGIIAVANLWGGPRDVYAHCYDSDFSQDDNFPTIFIHGTGDTTMDYTHSLNTYNRMNEKGIIVSWNPISGAEHSLIGTDDTYEMTVGLISEFFTDRLAEKIAAEGYSQPPILSDRAEKQEMPKSTAEIIYPNADLYVNSNNYGKNASFYNLDSLYVYDSSNSSYIRHTYMRFDTVAAEDGSSPESVILNFTVTNTTGVSSSSPLNIEIYGVSDNHWFENEVTYKNSPSADGRTYIGTVSVTGNGDYSIDVTNYVYKMRQSGVPTVTFCLQGKDTPASARRATIASVESYDKAPYLACSYAEEGLKTHSLSVNIVGVGTVDYTEWTVVHGSSLSMLLKPGASYVASEISIDTSSYGVMAFLKDNEVFIENIVADTELTVYFNPNSNILIASDSTTVRYNSQNSVVVNTTDTSIEGNINPLFLCTKGPSGGKNNGSDRMIWVTFDIENYDVGSEKVYFEIYCYKVVDFSGATMPVDVYATTNSEWSSDTLTWGNQITADNLVLSDGNLTINGSAQKIGEFSVKKASMWYSVDITSYVRALKMSGFTSFSLCLVDRDYTKTAPMARFVSTHGTATDGGESLAPRLKAEGGEQIDLNVTVEGAENGRVSGYTGVDANSSAVINVTANEGYRAYAKVNGEDHPVTDGKLCLFGADENTEIVISFVKEHAITLNCSASITATLSSETALSDESVTLDLITSVGYKPLVKVNGQQVEIKDNKLVLTVNDDISIIVEAIPII